MSRVVLCIFCIMGIACTTTHQEVKTPQQQVVRNYQISGYIGAKKKLAVALTSRMLPVLVSGAWAITLPTCYLLNYPKQTVSF